MDSVADRAWVRSRYNHSLKSALNELYTPSHRYREECCNASGNNTVVERWFVINQGFASPSRLEPLYDWTLTCSLGAIL